MVLSHGITDSAECWPGVAALLAGHFDLVMVDARGHGKSGRPEAGYSYEKQVSALRAVDWEQTVDALRRFLLWAPSGGKNAGTGSPW